MEQETMVVAAQNATENGVRTEVTRSEISLDKPPYKAEYQKEGTLTAQIRQTVTTTKSYPSKKVSSSMQDNIFGANDFGFASQDFSSVENRLAWIPVPSVATEDNIKALLAKALSNGACIYKVLSNEPILDENQIYAISQGFKTKDDFANSQVVRYPEGTKEGEVDMSNQLVLDKNSNVQYRRTFFSSTAKADQDLRKAENVYVSETIASELKGASQFKSQTF